MPLKLLYLPHGRRHRYFSSLFSAAVVRRGWRVGVLTQSAHRASFPFVVRDDDLFDLPDFAFDARSGIGNNIQTAALIVEAERATGIPSARLLIASERDFGRGFSKPFVHLPERRVVADVLADNFLPSQIAVAIFARMAGVLDRFQPDVLVTGNLAAPHHLALAMLARARGIPVVVGRPSKIHSDRSFWTTDLFMQNEAVEQQMALNVMPDEKGIRYLDEFRKKPRMIAYIARTWRQGAAESWIGRHRYFVELLYLQLKHAVLGKLGAPPKPFWPAIVEYYKTELLAFRQRQFFARPSEASLKETRFVYLALHKEPELAINFQAVAWHNQYNTAATLAASLPHGMRLVVREHRFNRGRRPSRYYRELLSLPNVIVVDPFDDQFKYIINAAVIVTDNGSTGWEGLLFGRPVVTLDRTFYDAVGLARQVLEPALLGKTLLDLIGAPRPSTKDADDRLARFVAAEWATTTADDGEEGLVENISVLEGLATRVPTILRQATTQ